MLNPSKNIIKMLPDYFKKSDSNMKEILDTGDVPLLEYENGWIEFEVLDNMLFVYTAYSDGNKNTKKIWDSLLKEAKNQGCTKVEMITERNPKAWQKLYKFKVRKSRLTLDLKGDN
tara:strand:- start:12442 stop:12789 length:348 start_codon:yes stop_codon:yes gene_type:complete